MGFTSQEYSPCPKLQHNKLEKLGFEWMDNLQSYHARFSDSYYSELVGVKVVGETASIVITNMHSKWCRDLARKAITALSNQNEYPDSFDLCLGGYKHE